MKNLLVYLRAKPTLFFVVRFTLLYITGRFLFFCYVGALYPSGSVYWPFLSYVDIIQGLRVLLIYPTSWILNIFGNETSAFKMGLLLNQYFGGIRIEYPCLGIEIMIAYISLILAYAAPNRYWYLLGGLLLIHLVNIARMVGLIEVQVHHLRNNIQLIHDLFNIIAYAAILILFYIYTRGDKEKINT